MLTAVVVMNTVSVLGSALWRPVPGDFELTEIGVAVAVFMFLPYCQIMQGNVTADIFTARAGPRLLAAFSLLASILALGFALLLFWRMQAGLVDQKTYGYVTAILQVPIWAGFVPILGSLALLAMASAVNLAEAIRSLSRGRE